MTVVDGKPQRDRINAARTKEKANDLALEVAENDLLACKQELEASTKHCENLSNAVSKLRTEVLSGVIPADSHVDGAETALRPAPDWTRAVSADVCSGIISSKQTKRWKK